MEKHPKCERGGRIACPEHKSENMRDVRESVAALSLQVNVGKMKECNVEGEEIRGMGLVEERERNRHMGVPCPKENIHKQITSKGVGDKSIGALHVLIRLNNHVVHTSTPINPQQHQLRFRVC